MKPKPGSLRMRIKWLKLKLASLGKRKAQIANIKKGITGYSTELNESKGIV